jgi:hypothetical protein
MSSHITAIRLDDVPSRLHALFTRHQGRGLYCTAGALSDIASLLDVVSLCSAVSFQRLFLSLSPSHILTRCRLLPTTPIYSNPTATVVATMVPI